MSVLVGIPDGRERVPLGGGGGGGEERVERLQQSEAVVGHAAGRGVRLDKAVVSGGAKYIYDRSEFGFPSTSHETKWAMTL